MQASAAPVLAREDGGVFHIVLNRPQAANAIDSAMARALAAAIGDAARSKAGAVLLSSTGRQYCAGGDIGEFMARRGDLDQLVRDMLDILHPAIHTLATLPVPVLSAVHGPVGGAGIAVALCADIVLASPAMKLRGGYSAIGLSPDLGAAWHLARRAGAARAKSILMTNRALPAEECLRLGLVDALHPADALQAETAALAGELARGATGALGGIKRLCDEAPRLDLHTHLQRERLALLRCARSGDGREGVSAFMEKRTPAFGDPRIDRRRDTSQGKEPR